MGIEALVSRQAIESRAFYAARRIFGRYGVNVASPDVSPGSLHRAMRRMTAKEYTCVIGAFAAVMVANGRMVQRKQPELTEAEAWKKLQETAHHLKNHPEDLPKVAS